MLIEKTCRYVLLLLLPAVIASLYLFYLNIRNEKASIILLESYYPYNEYDLEETQHQFRSFANPYYYGFFQDSTMFVNLVDKFSELKKSLDSIELPLAHVEEKLWASKLSPFQFYNYDISVAENKAAALYRASKEYVDAFWVVLKQPRWRSQRNYDGSHLYMDIDLDVKSSEAALKEFEKMFVSEFVIEIDITLLI